VLKEVFGKSCNQIVSALKIVAFSLSNSFLWKDPHISAVSSQVQYTPFNWIWIGQISTACQYNVMQPSVTAQLIDHAGMGEIAGVWSIVLKFATIVKEYSEQKSSINANWRCSVLTLTASLYPIERKRVLLRVISVVLFGVCFADFLLLKCYTLWPIRLCNYLNQSDPALYANIQCC